MSTSDADKPPICSPSSLPDKQCEPAAAGTTDREDVVDATIAPTQIPYRPGTMLHWTFLVIAVAVVAASLSLSVHNGEQVILPIIDVPLPGTCTFRTLTGLPCPGCGLTRSFISMGHANFRDAWNYNPAGFLFFVVVAFQIPYRIYQLRRIRRGRDQHRFAWIDNWILIALVVALIVQWIYGLMARMA